MRIATWNVNSVKKRLPHLVAFLKDAKPDVLCLQELKCQDADFPMMEIEAAGYSALVHGQKAYNGVAILAREKPVEIMVRLPAGDSDEHARYIEASVGGVRVASIYLPNGNPAPGDKYKYKLAWMDRLLAHARALLAREQPIVLAGDFNVCPTDFDVWDPKLMAGDALCLPESRAALRKIINLGYTDAIRALHPNTPMYTYWDYMQNRWARDHGLRIDHLLLSPRAADRLKGAGVDRTPRAKAEASDHTPAWVDLD